MIGIKNSILKKYDVFIWKHVFKVWCQIVCTDCSELKIAHIIWWYKLYYALKLHEIPTWWRNLVLLCKTWKLGLHNFCMSLHDFDPLLKFFYSGLRCHLEDACTSSPCHEGASCETSPINGDPICSCKRGWTGSDCSVDVNECHESEYTFLSLSHCSKFCTHQGAILFPSATETSP